MNIQTNTLLWQLVMCNVVRLLCQLHMTKVKNTLTIKVFNDDHGHVIINIWFSIDQVIISAYMNSGNKCQVNLMLWYMKLFICEFAMSLCLRSASRLPTVRVNPHSSRRDKKWGFWKKRFSSFMPPLGVRSKLNTTLRVVRQLLHSFTAAKECAVKVGKNNSRKNIEECPTLCVQLFLFILWWPNSPNCAFA